MSKGKYLGIDYGDKRIGMAISDYNKEISFPRDFLEYTDESKLIQEVKTFCEAEEITRIVLGLPIQMTGVLGDRAKITQAFYEKLKEAMPQMDIAFFDERLSTQFAISSLRGQGITAKNQKGKRDVMSAQIILQNYLASLRQ